MTSFELNIVDEKTRAGVEFLGRVVNELQRALAEEKSHRKLTQQMIAEKIETSRAVVNRQVQGIENISARRIGELFWAIGWEPCFEARKIPAGSGGGRSMSDYHDLDSHWYCAMSVSVASRAARRDAKEVIEWTRKLLAHDYDAEAATRLARAETALSEALLAVKVARAEYERKQPQILEAAE